MAANEVREVPGGCPGWLDAATSLEGGALVMLETAVRAGPRAREGADGIFRPERLKWRGATLRVALDGEEPFVARLDDVVNPRPGNSDETRRVATLSEPDASGRPFVRSRAALAARGEVRVVRAP
jgi:hypothetical protein